MVRRALRLHPDDDMAVALTDLRAGESVLLEDASGPVRAVRLAEDVPAKHKVALRSFADGELVRLYGVVVGATRGPVAEGGWVRRERLVHRAAPLAPRRPAPPWRAPRAKPELPRTFEGYHRADGRVGTANHWLVIPLVFCENRKVELLRDALVEALGYAPERTYREEAARLAALARSGQGPEQLLAADLDGGQAASGERRRVFPHVDGIRFLFHHMGCGGTPDDARALVRLLAACIRHPNVAGATVLSLGCQHAQVAMLREALDADPAPLGKPLLVFEEQRGGTERAFVTDILRHTFAGLSEANAARRAPAPLSKLVLGVKCGASDGFSGLSANAALGHASDLVVGQGGGVLLGELPELHGVEQALVDRCRDDATAERFVGLMRAYAERLAAHGSSFDDNPSPGNIRDGLITDAMKSAGAARKGGTSPVEGVLDYGERIARPGLHIVCTPGHDVESVTGLAASGANVIAFTTGLGTGVGHPFVPVVKIASHTALAGRLPDLVDLDTGGIVRGTETIDAAGERLLDALARVASGQLVPKAVSAGQEDFLPWKRGISL